jgi:hypothetical protein
MITDSSKNYMDNTLTLIYDGETVSVQEIYDYCLQNHNVVDPIGFTIEPPNEGYGGYPNPGTVTVRLPRNGVDS